MKIIYVIEIPIPDYYGENVYHQKLFFENSPSFQQVKEVLHKLHERDKKYPEYIGDWDNCLRTLEAFTEEKWRVINTSVACTSEHFECEYLANNLSKYDQDQVYISWKSEEVH